MAARVGASVAKVNLLVGRELAGEPSESGLYAVCKPNGWPLRVTLFRDAARMWADESRVIHECWIES